MDSLILSNQSAFLKGRCLVDGVLVVNEAVGLAKRKNIEGMIFKVDFKKRMIQLFGIFWTTCYQGLGLMAGGKVGRGFVFVLIICHCRLMVALQRKLILVEV